MKMRISEKLKIWCLMQGWRRLHKLRDGSKSQDDREALQFFMDRIMGEVINIVKK